MATSNIEAVRSALQSLSEVLDPYIERVTAKRALRPASGAQ